MRADYERIASEHLAGYGIFSHHLDAYEDFYSDDLHFLYELIQNAQDAISANPDKARKHRLLRLVLRDTELLAYNDGVPFTERHVRAICSIRQSTKDLTQVGTHGIGFKATGKFTDAPEIYSGEEHFRIRRKVIPELITDITSEIAAFVAQGVTVFRLPFRSDLREGSVDSLAERLRHIHRWALLFLHDLCRVEWIDERGSSVRAEGNYLRDSIAHPEVENARIVSLRSFLKGDSGDSSEESQFLTFSRERTPPTWVVDDLLARARDPRERERIEGSRAHPQPVEIAFALDEGRKVVPLPDSTSVLFSFLPTGKESGLRFLIQAHFKTTFARDNIRDVNEFAWNRWLLSEASALLPDALLALERVGMMTPAVVRTLPIPKEDVPDGEGKPRLIHSIVSACIKALHEHPLIPTDQDGTCSVSEQVFYPHNHDLRGLLLPSELAEVTEVKEALWLHPDLRWSEENEGGLLRAAGVREVSPSQVVDWLATKDAAWFAGRTDDWLAALYHYLASPVLRSERERLKALPLVRMEDGSHVCASAPDQAAFFPPSGEGEARIVGSLLSLLPFLRGSLLPSGSEGNGGGVRPLLREIGVRPLNLFGLLRDWLLPKYKESGSEDGSNTQSTPPFSPDENRAHVRFLVESLTRLPQKEAAELSKAARDIPFLLCRSVGNAERKSLSLKAPIRSYLPAAFTRSTDLEIYFGLEDNATNVSPVTAWFVDEGYFDTETDESQRETWRKALNGFGVATRPRLMRIVNPVLSDEFKATLRGGQKAKADSEQIEDYTFSGLDNALARIAAENEESRRVSLALWRLMARTRAAWSRDQQLFAMGKYQWSDRFHNDRKFPSSADTSLRTSRWVLTEDGTFATPSELYIPNAETRRVLGQRVRYLSSEAGVEEHERSQSRGTPEDLLAHTLGVKAHLDIPAVLEHLEFLSNLNADEAPSVEEVAEAYATLQRLNIHSQQQHRDTFKSKSFLFTLTPEPRWWKVSEAFWKDEESAFGDTRAYLEPHYPASLKPFFAAVGVVESASLPDLARALLTLAEQGNSEEERVRRQAHTLYERIWTKLGEPEALGVSGKTASAVQERASREAEAREAWRRLLGARCWLGCTGTSHWEWHGRSTLFLNDHDHNTALFADHLPFWPLPDLNDFARFAELTAASQARIDFRPLDGQESKGHKERPYLSEQVRGLADHIADFLASPRLVGEAYSPRNLDFLASLRVVLVRQAEVTYTLGGVTVLDPNPLTSYLHVSEDGNEATLWITADSEDVGELPDLIGDALAVYINAWQLSGFVSRLLSSNDVERVLSYWQKLGLRYGYFATTQESAISSVITDSESIHSGSFEPNHLFSEATEKSSDQSHIGLISAEDAGRVGGNVLPLNDRTAEEMQDAAVAQTTVVHPAVSQLEMKRTNPNLSEEGNSGVIGRPKYSYPVFSGRPIYMVSRTHTVNADNGSGRRSRYGSAGGEGETHRALKALVRDNPTLIGGGLTFVKEEYAIASGLAGSEVDVLLKDEKGNPVCVECKPSISAGDYTPIWQIIRYKHLVAVEYGLSCDKVRAVLVAPYISPDVQSKCSLMGVDCQELRPRATGNI